jgi:hypothetical protein
MKESESAMITKAARAIGGVLEDLERTTGKRVGEISLRMVDVTTLQDPMPRLLTSVVIQLEDPYRREWA